MAIRFGNRNTSASQKGGGGCLIVFGLVFALMGGAATFFIAKQALDESVTYQWTETLCQIESCEIAADESRDDSPFRIKVRYSYNSGGQQFTSDRYTLGENWSDSYEDLALERKALLSRDGVSCYVDPELPANAVLKRAGLTTGLFALFPLIFVAVGIGIIWAGIIALRHKKASDSGGHHSISAMARGGKASGWVVGAIVGGIFFFVGAGMLYPLGIKPITRMIDSKNWVETPCTVIWSRVQSHSNDDGTTYSVDIFYEYEFEGLGHRSNRLSFFEASSSGRSAKRQYVKEHPKGSQQFCFVNPKIPEQAVMEAGFSWSALFALFPLVFGGVGFLVLFASIKSRSKARAPGSAGSLPSSGFQPASDTPSRFDSSGGSTASIGMAGVEAYDSSPKILKPGGKRLGCAIASLFICLFWNGITSIFVYQAIESFRRGNPEWFLTIFMIPFVLVGLAMILFFFYQLLSLANPKPIVTLTPGTPRLGEPFEMRWNLRGSASRLSGLKFEIRGVEAATYRRGTRTHTDHEVFYAEPVASASRLLEIRAGDATSTIPADLMYSLDLGNNEIQYYLRVSGDIPFWPDISDQYEIKVLPPAIT